MPSHQHTSVTTPGTTPFRGREQQWSQILRLFEAAKSRRRGGVLLVEGPPGSGRSRLLSEAAAAATHAGLLTVHAAADEVRRAVPLAPLASALGGSGSTSLTDDAGSAGPAALIDGLRARLEERLRVGPLTVLLDDLHWADQMTLAALRSLVVRLTAHPIVWILTRSTGSGEPTVRRLFAALRDAEGAEQLELAPLGGGAVAELAADRLGAEPIADLLRYLDGADGNPAALVALLDGLAEEGWVRVVDGGARLAGAAAEGRPPRRFGTLVRQRMEAFQPATRLLLDVAAVLGRDFTPDDASRILGQPTAAVLPALWEALDSTIVACEDDTIAFRHELVRQTLLATLPRPLRGALHRQAADMILNRGGDLRQAAPHLMYGARRGDGQAATALGDAAIAVADTEPHTAAELALRALEIGDPGAATRPLLFHTAVETLIRVGPLPRAVALAREALNSSPPRDRGVAMRRELSSALLLAGRATEALAVAGDGDLPDEVRPNRLHSLAALNVTAAVHVASREAGHPADASADMLGALAVTAWCAGRVDEGLRLARTAVEREVEGSGSPHIPSRMILAVMLTYLRHTAEATAAVEALAAEIDSDGRTVLRGVPLILGAALDLTRGALDEAVTGATAGLAAAEAVGMPLLSPLGWRVLADVALRRGDIAAAAGHVQALELSTTREHLDGDDAHAFAAFGAWMAAQLAAAHGDPAALNSALLTVRRDSAALRRLLAVEPAAAAWLVRTALDADDGDQATETARAARSLAEDNVDMQAAAAHAHGLYARDPRELRRAVDEHRDPWARASATEDLGSLPGSPRDAAVDALSQAMERYSELGAERDKARVRRKLRRLGVRRRHWTVTERPTFGWASLTDTERRVATLVAQGLTNRQVAVQMFLSPHTVGFHLRQIFRKLRIESRVSLARVLADAAIEPPNPATANQ